MRDRIKGTETVQDMIVKLAEGNPGALTVLLQIVEHGNEIDPDSFSGWLSTLLLLDIFRIYGPAIWMLYKDVARESLPVTLALLRAVQLGLLDRTTLEHAIATRGQGLDVPAALKAVRERLPRFRLDGESA